MLISLAGCQSDINNQFIGQTVHHSVVVITVGQLNKVPDGNKSERLSSVSYPTKKINYHHHHHHHHRHHRQDIL